MLRNKLIILLLVLGVPMADAGDPQVQKNALDKMGELNGVALACRYFDQTRRIKQALIDSLPKQRELGAAFDDRTNESFLDFANSGKPCPSPVGFAQEVEAAAQALGQAYAVQ